MMKMILVVVLVIGCPLLWIMVAVPFIARSFGAPYNGVLPFDRQNEGLNKLQSFVFAGVLAYGIGLCSLGTLVAHFIDGKEWTISDFWMGIFWCFVLGPLMDQVHSWRRN
jgi:hypothetical protein